MNKLPEQIIENVFPDERHSLFVWLKQQKRNLRSWLITLFIVVLILFIINIQAITIYIAFHFQSTINLIFIFWIITLVVLPFLWPGKPGDIFLENFKSGLNPRIWDWDGIWRTELDENGKPVLSVTNSGIGGIVIPCISWVDYELNFDTRIMNTCTGWIVRASSSSNYVMFQINENMIRPHILSHGIWIEIQEIPHSLTIISRTWYSIRTIVRGSWATIYIKIDGKDHQIFQDRIFATRPPKMIEIPRPSPAPETSHSPVVKDHQIVETSLRTGTFGFRLAGTEFAQFRNIKAYRIR